MCDQSLDVKDETQALNFN